MTIDGTKEAAWDSHFLGTSVTSWGGGTSVDVYGFAEGGYLYVAYLADTTKPGYVEAASLGVGANFDYWTPSTASWPAPGFTHISVGGDGFAQTDGSGWVFPDGWGNGDWSGRGIEYFVGDPTYGPSPGNFAELKIPLAQIEYAGTDGVVGLSGQYWQYDFAEPFYVQTLSAIPEPSSVVGLLSMGLVGALGIVWRRRRQTA